MLQMSPESVAKFINPDGRPAGRSPAPQLSQMTQAVREGIVTFLTGETRARTWGASGLSAANSLALAIAWEWKGWGCDSRMGGAPVAASFHQPVAALGWFYCGFCSAGLVVGVGAGLA